MKIWITAAAVTLATPLAWSAPLIDLTGNIGYSFNSLNEGSLMNGDVKLESSNSGANNIADLNQEAENGIYASAKIGLPIFPDIGLKYESLVSSGSNNDAFTQDIYGEDFTVNGDIDSELDLSYLDITLSYGVPFPMASFDFGLNFRSMQGGFEADFDSGAQNESVSAPFELNGSPLIVPMGYLAASFTPPIPSTDLTLSGEIKSLPLGDTNITDWNVKGTWFAPLPTDLLAKVGVEAGYRQYSLVIGDKTLGSDTSDFASDVKFTGFFLGTTVQF